MICKASIVLVVDTNMLLSIASDHKSESLIKALSTWASSMVRDVKPTPRGKIITVLVTKDILHDYWTGLSHGGYRVNQGTKKEFNAYTGKSIMLDRDLDVRFGVMAVQEKTDLGKIDVGDRYDLPYPRLLLTIADKQKWSDRHVIFGSNDAKMLYNTRDVVLRRVQGNRFHFAAGRSDFEDVIMC